MKPTNDIIPIWQPQGYSTNHLANMVGKLYGKKATHTGTLDPMAEGIVIILLDETRLKRQELSSSVKGYEFEIAFGIKTDSFDGMGIIQEPHEVPVNKNIPLESLEEVCRSFIGDYVQQIPIFSAQLYKGKKLFEWGHQKIAIPLPNKRGNIYQLNVLDLYELDFSKAVVTILSKLSNIKGNFRQQEIVSQWESFKDNNPFGFRKLLIAKFYVENSRGLYVRSLSQDICSKLGISGFVFSLKRLRNSDYYKGDCSTLDTLFGENYDTILRS